MDRFMEKNEEISLLSGLLYYWNIVWAFRVLISLLTILGAIISVVFSIITIRLPPNKSPLPNVYKAYTKLIIHKENASDSGSMVALMEMMGMEVSGGAVSDNGTQAQLIYSSYPFADIVVERLGFSDIYGIPKDNKLALRNVFYNGSSFIYSTRTNILVLTYESIDKVFAANVVDVMLDELTLWFDNQGGSSSQNQLEIIENKLFEVNNEINKLSNSIKDIQKKYGTLSIEVMAESQQELISSLTNRLLDLDLQIESQSNSFSPIETNALKVLRSQRVDIVSTLDRLKNGQEVAGRIYPPNDELPDLATEFNRLQLLLQIQEQIYLSLTEKYEVLKLADSSKFNYTILEPVEVPWRKSGPKRSLICIYMTIGGAVVGVALAFFITIIRSILDKRKKEGIFE